MGSGWRRVMQDLGESQVDQWSGAQQSKSCPFRIIELLFLVVGNVYLKNAENLSSASTPFSFNFV